MKLFVMKLTSLFTFLVGLALLGHLLGALQRGQLHANYDKLAPPQVREVVPFIYFLYVVGFGLAVFGFYGFVPSLGGKKKRSIAFAGDHGDVIVHLDTVESTLTRVLSNMPEVKKIRVRVQADGKGKKATIVADCVLQDRPDVPARQAADAVNEYLTEAAGNILGVEDIEKVKLNIVGVDVNAKASSLYLEAEHAARMKALEAKRLPQAPGLVAGAPALAQDAVMPYVPSQSAVPFADIPAAEPVVDTSNLNAHSYVQSENADPAASTAFEDLAAEEEPKKPENEA